MATLLGAIKGGVKNKIYQIHIKRKLFPNTKLEKTKYFVTSQLAKSKKEAREKAIKDYKLDMRYDKIAKIDFVQYYR